MSEIRKSLDRLLQVVTNGEENERIEMFYIIEPKNSGRLENVASDNDETILHIAVERKVVSISFEAGSDTNKVQGRPKTTFTLEDKTYEFVKKIGDVLKASGLTSVSLGKQSSSECIDDYCDSYYGGIEGGILRVFLEIIHRECQNKAEVTAEKLMTLGYPLFQIVLLRNAEVIEHMLIRGCPVNDCDTTDQSTALSKAVRLMNLEIVTVLIKYGADVDLANSRGMLPIAGYTTGYDCDRPQQPGIVKMLLNESILIKDLPCEDVFWQFKEIFRCGNREVIQILLEHRNDILNARESANSRTPLHYLCENPHPDITELLEGQEIDVNVRSKFGLTPLLTAVSGRNTHINTVKFLLENGADVNAADNYGDVPVFELCRGMGKMERDDVAILELFLQHNVDIQYVKSDQTTVIDSALRSPRHMVMILLKHLAMLEAQGHPIIEIIYKKISSEPWMKGYFDHCKADLGKMKNIYVYEKLTLYMIFTNSVSEKQILKSGGFSSEALANVEKLKKELCPDNQYYAKVQKRISSIVLTQELRRKAAPVMSQLLQLGNSPCHVVVTEIIYYLDIPDLQSLIKIEF